MSIISIFATVLIAVTIQRVQNDTEKKQKLSEQKHARGVFFDTVLLAIQQMQRYAKISIYDDKTETIKTVRITERHFEALSEMDNALLSKEERELFHFLLSDLERLNKHEVEDEKYELFHLADNIANEIFIPAYSFYIKLTAEPVDLVPFLLPAYQNVFSNAGYAFTTDRFINRDAEDILILNSDNTWDVIDANGVKIAESITVDSRGISTGFGTYKDFHKGETYIGEWSEYQPHGKGRLYKEDYDTSQLKIDKEGIWHQGEFSRGTIHHRIIHKIFKENERLPEDAYFFNWNHEGNIYTDQIVNLYFENDTYTVEKHLSPLCLHKKDSQGDVDEDEMDSILDMQEYLQFDSTALEHIVHQKVPVDEIFPLTECPEEVSKKDLEMFNRIIENNRSQVNIYNEEMREYQYAQCLGKEFEFCFTNSGMVDIEYFKVQITFPPELSVIRGTKEILREPLIPRVFENVNPNLLKRPFPWQYLLNDMMSGITLPTKKFEAQDLSEQTIVISHEKEVRVEDSVCKGTFIITPSVKGEFLVKLDYLVDGYIQVQFTDYVKVLVE